MEKAALTISRHAWVGPRTADPPLAAVLRRGEGVPDVAPLISDQVGGVSLSLALGGNHTTL